MRSVCSLQSCMLCPCSFILCCKCQKDPAPLWWLNSVFRRSPFIWFSCHAQISFHLSRLISAHAPVWSFILVSHGLYFPIDSERISSKSRVCSVNLDIPKASVCCLKRENHTALLTDPTDGHSLVIPSETRQKLMFPQMVVVHSDKARNTGLISAVIISIASLLPK